MLNWVYDDRNIKAKIKTYGDEVFASFHGLNAPEDGVECESFTVTSIDFLLINGNTYFLENWANKVVDKQMTNYLNNILFESDKDFDFLLL